MLIQTPPQANDVISLKMISGEEIIGRYTEETDDTITLTKPLAFMMGPKGAGLAPMLFSAANETKVRLTKSAVVCMVKTDDDFAKQYIEQTTGLTLARG